MKKLISPLILLFLLAGCKNETPVPEFDNYTIDEVSELNCDPEEENCAYISINIPWVENAGSRNKKINQHIEHHVINLIDYQEENNQNSLESLSQNFIDNYEISATEFPEYNIPWEASVEGRVLQNLPHLISIEFNLALFTGGAHGFISTSYLNIDPKTGELFSNDDLFTQDFISYAEKIFRKKHEIPVDQTINSTGYFFENDSFHLPQNIGFLNNKVILRYNAYEVASYSEGGIQLEIPTKDVEDFIKIL